MNKTLISLASLSILAGCATSPNPEIDKFNVDPVPVHPVQQVGLDHPGQAFIAEGYIRNGVIVTPGRNWFFGQGHGFRHPGATDRMTTMMEASDQYGGVVHGAYAEMRGNGRSADEQRALDRLEAMRVASAHGSSGVQAVPIVRSQDFIRSFSRIPVAEVLDYLSRVDMDQITVIEQQRIRSEIVPLPLFEFGKSDVRPQYVAQLRALGATLRNMDRDMALLHLEGFTDNIGTQPTNNRLSLERAINVHAILVNEGVNRDALTVTGSPLCCYRATNKTDAGRNQNRRVEMRPGGIYAASDVTGTHTGVMIARILKTIGDRPFTPIRVIGSASNQEEASALRDELMRLLVSSEVGLKNVSKGEAGYSPKPKLVIEIME